MLFFQFKDSIDTSRIEGFTVVIGRSAIVYQYQASSFNNDSTVETNGRTYVRNIPLLSITRDDAKVSVFITSNGIVHPQSEPASIEKCMMQEVTTTSTYNFLNL